MRDWLQSSAIGHESLFLDFDPADGIRGGSDWKQVLYDRLCRCQAVIVLLSENWLASKWCFAEAVQARGAGKQLIFAKIASCEADPAFSELQHIDLTGNAYPSNEGYDRLKCALAETFDLVGDRPPYPGLPAFQKDDAAIYFGREEETHQTMEMLERLRRNQPSANRFLLILGASGSGKSSLMRAGVLPRLASHRSRWLVVPPFVPGGDPLGSMASALAEASAAAGAEKNVEKLKSALESDEGGDVLAETLASLPLLGRWSEREAAVLLAVDQVDDLIPTSGATVHFWRHLHKALDQKNGKILAFGTLRSDLFGKFQEHPGVASQRLSQTERLRYETLTLDPLPHDRFRSIILGPAERVGLEIEPSLVARMVDDAKASDALPLLAFVLHRMWTDEQIRADMKFELEEYKTLGGIETAIRREAEAARAQLISMADDASATDEALRALFIPGLVELKDEGVVTRRTALLSELPGQAKDLIRPFISARLLTIDGEEDREWVRVTHEAMLRNWPTLTRWIEQDRSKLTIFAEVRRDAEDWDADDRNKDRLNHRDSRLQVAEDVLAEPRFSRTAEDSPIPSYIRACREATDEALQGFVDANLAALRAVAEQNFSRANFNDLLAVRTRTLPWRDDAEAYLERLQTNSEALRCRGDEILEKAFNINGMTLNTQVEALRRKEHAAPLCQTFSITALPAKYGTALLLEYGDEQSSEIILYGGGAPGAYRKTLKPALEAIAAQKRLDRPRLDLIIMPQQDQEYLKGADDLFQDLNRAQESTDRFDIDIGGYWHNHFAPMVGPNIDNISNIPHWPFRDRSAIIARSMNIPVNEPFDYFVAAADTGPARITFESGLAVTIMGPAPEDLEALHETWRKQVEKKFEGKIISLVDQIGGFVEGYSSTKIELIRAPRLDTESIGLDRSVPNLSSILSLFEFGGKRVLLCADADGGQIIRGLKTAGELKPGSHAQFDALLVPHSGSDRNVSLEFFQQVRADHYIFSADGTHGNPEPQTLDWLLEARKGDDRPYSLHFTYDLDEISEHRHYQGDDRRLSLGNVRKRIENAVRTGRIRGVFAPEAGALGAVISLLDEPG